MTRQRVLRRRARQRRAQDRLEHAREARIEVVDAQRVEPRGPLLPLMDHACLAQHLEVVRAGGLAHADIEAAATALARGAGQSGRDLETNRIAERVQDCAELDLVTSWVGDLLGCGIRRGHVLRPLYDEHRIFDTVRRPSYYGQGP